MNLIFVALLPVGITVCICIFDAIGKAMQQFKDPSDWSDKDGSHYSDEETR